ncbi:MAG TPA: hypothetical protein PLU50_03410, partial [Pseudobdellovibrionaceae bacterium]|nr:hypothetical protein [Pseudobdellovibrionaceae bacterium]
MRRLQNRNPIARNLPLFIHLFFWMSICADPAGAGTAPIPEGIAVPSLEASQASKTNPADLSWLCVSVILHEELTAMKLDSTQNKLREQAILAFLNEWNRAILQTSKDSSQFSSRTFLGEYLKLQRTQNKPSELSVFQNFYMQEIKPNSRLAISRIIHQEGFVRWSDRVKLILQASTLYLAINEDLTNAAIQIGQILSRLDFNQQNKAKIHQYFEGLAHAPMTRESARFTGTDSLIPGALGLKLFSASKVGHLIGQHFEKIVQYLNQSQNLNLARASLITSTATATTGVLNYQELEAKKRLTSMTHPLPHRNLKSMSSELQYPSLEELVLDASDLLAAPIVTPAIRKMRANRLVDFVLLAEAEVAAQRFHWSSSTKERFLMAAYESIENVSAKVRNIIERKRRSNQDITFEDIFYIRGSIFPILSGNNPENPLSILSALGTTVPDDLKGVAPKFGTNQIGHTLLVAAILAPYFGNDSNWKLGVQFYANGLHPVLVPKTFPFNNPQAWDLIRGSWVPEKYMIDAYSPDAFIVNFLYQLRNWHESQSSRTATMNALGKLKRDDFLIQLGMHKMEGYNCNGVCYPLGKSFLDRFGPLMSHLFSSDIKLPAGETHQEILPPKATEAEESIPDSTQNSETMSVAQYALAKIFSTIYKTNPPSRKQFQTNAEYETRRAVLKLSPWETASGFRLENESVVQIEEITNEKNENAFPWAESHWKLEYILSGPNIGHNGMVSTKTIEVLLSSFGKIQTSPLWLKWKKSNFDLDQMITSQTAEGEHILKSLKTLRTLTVLQRRAP